MTEVFHHHYHHRKHGPKKNWVHSKKWKNIVDNCVYLISTTGIFMTLPQAYDVCVKSNISGVSLSSWSWYTLSASFWILYGVAHKEKPIIYINLGWFLVELLIVIGIIIK